MEGAIESGIRAAREVLGLKTLADCHPCAGTKGKVDNWWEKDPVVVPHDGNYAGYHVEELGVHDGMQMAGYIMQSQKGSGAGDKLYARALYLADKDDNEVVFCAVDLHSVSTYLLNEVHEILKHEGLSSRQVVLAATGTCNGPAHYLNIPLFDFLLSRYKLGKQRRFDDLLAKRLAEDIARAIRGAMNSKVPAKLGFGETKVWGASVNRSVVAFKANPDHAHWNDEGWPGHGAPAGDTHDAERFVDPRVRALAAFDGDDELIGAFATFGCHATSLGPHYEHYGRDWPGVAVANQRVALAMGAFGDISPLPAAALDAPDPSTSQGTTLRDARGAALAEGVAAAVAAAKEARKTAAIDVRTGFWGPPNDPQDISVGWPALGGSEDGRSKRTSKKYREGYRDEDAEQDDQYPKAKAWYWGYLSRPSRGCRRATRCIVWSSAITSL